MQLRTIVLAVMFNFLINEVSLAHEDSFTLVSPDLIRHSQIKPEYYWDNFGCTGKNTRPELLWRNVPKGTKSFAVTFYDEDAPTGSGFWHWVVYDIPATAKGLKSNSLPTRSIESNTDMGKPGYIGPCPPVGRQHTYTYRVHALDVDTLQVPEKATAALTGFFIHQHTISVATLPVVAGPRS